MKYSSVIALLLSTASATKGELGNQIEVAQGPNQHLGQLDAATNAKLLALGQTKLDVYEETYAGKKPCQKANCSDYRGKMNVTKSGRKCQAWTKDKPHTTHEYKPADRPGRGLEDGAFCRNPDDEPMVWCFTMDTAKTWEVCESPLIAEAEPVEVIVKTVIAQAPPPPPRMPPISCHEAKGFMEKAEAFVKTSRSSYESQQTVVTTTKVAWDTKMSTATNAYNSAIANAKSEMDKAQADYDAAAAAAQAKFDAANAHAGKHEATFLKINSEYTSATAHLEQMSVSMKMGAMAVSTCVPLHPPIDRRLCQQAKHLLAAKEQRLNWFTTEITYHVETRDWYLGNYKAYRSAYGEAFASSFYNNYQVWNKKTQALEVKQAVVVTAIERLTINVEKKCGQ